ncbi:MAG: hypothetical protein BWY95_02032 [Bacteroidetes bacterium ADurb.BinA104]|nr:MAG: hypothetical protein BWY95_02032 [Bacteroidetes bacterium ADurb.BinA104]
MRLNYPCDHLTRFSGRKQTAQYEPSVLGNHTAVIKLQKSVIRCYLYHTLRSIGSNQYVVTRLQRQRIDKHISTAVIIGSETLKLPGFLAVGKNFGVAHGIARETVGTTIHEIGLAPVL